MSRTFEVPVEGSLEHPACALLALPPHAEWDRERTITNIDFSKRIAMKDSSTNRQRNELQRHARSKLAGPGSGPNPQGKGVVGFMLDWHYSSPRGVVAKSSPQLLAEYFTSLLVLSAAFKFKPAFETSYYLYCGEPQWALSLVSPDEWKSAEKTETFVGTCVLHADSTWSISPSDNVSRPGRVLDAIVDFYDGFVLRLKTAKPLEDELPFYEGRLPYYQRLFAAALSRSLKGSLTIGGQLSVESRQWLENLPRDAGRLIAAPKPEDN